VSALESARALVFVLSAAANAAPGVKRELERAAGRGIPIITYAVENVPPSAAIAYFTETVPPVAAWAGEDRERAIRTLVAATQQGLQQTRSLPERSGSRSSYTRATYRDAKGLQFAVATALIISVCLNAYVLYRDTSFVMSRLVGRQTAPVATAQDYFGSLSLVSAFGSWALLVAAIVVLRRARLNLLSMFINVRTSGGDILWRPFIPFVNAIWLPRMASDLRDPGASDEGAEPHDWPLARWWGIAFFCAYSLTGLRDGVANAAPQSLGLIVALSVVLDALQVLTPFLAYPVLAQVLDSVRARRYSLQMPNRTATNEPLHATSTADPSLGSNVLVISAAGDQAVAENVAGALEESGCRCWTSPATASQAPTASQLACFDAVLVVVSPASHSSDGVARAVAAALSGPAPVIPFVVDPPPAGSALGHYIRSLHWIDGAAGTAALRSQRIRAAFQSTRVSATTIRGTAPQIDEALFSPLAGVARTQGRYREARGLRATAKTLAIVQVVVAAIVGLLAFAIALNPENTDPSVPLAASLVLVAASLPAWSVFVGWLMMAYRNARTLQVRDLGALRWLVCQTAVPVVSSALSGRAIGRLGRAIVQADERGGTTMKHFAVVWTTAGLVWTIAAIAGLVLGVQQAIVAAMLATTVQSMATMVRGVLRVRTINDIGTRLDARARPWFAHDM
jgi:hypothetical protein